MLTPEVDAALLVICAEITNRYEIEFLEIGADRDHVHFLHPKGTRSVLTYSPTKIVRIIKSLTARELFAALPDLKKALWSGAFWSSGFFVNTTHEPWVPGRHGSETVIRRYVKQQGLKDYQQLHSGQLDSFVVTNQVGENEP